MSVFFTTDDAGFDLLGAYGGLVYAVPVIGGLLADRYLGMRKAVVLGGVGLVAMAIAYARFSFAERGVSKRRLRKQQRATTKLAATPPFTVSRSSSPSLS